MSGSEYEVSVDVSIRSPYGGGNIQLRETFSLGNCDFEDMANILHGFHELAISLRQARDKAEPK